jgi:hypothetical protein
LEWDQLKVHDYIYDNNYPMLRRALNDGFDHNFVLPNRGSLLGLSVVAGCYRCVKMLVERGADVNTPILMDEVIKVKGWNKLTSVKGWTPLMMAVADGNVRIVQELIESGSALVSKTGNGQEGPRFHAREVARRIENSDLRTDILNMMMLSSSEIEQIKARVENKSFIEAADDGDSQLLDDFWLLKSTNMVKIPDTFEIKSSCKPKVENMMKNEIIAIIED